MGSSYLGNTIQKLLRQRGMRPIQLAERAKIDQGQLSKVMHGKAYPSIDSLMRIASALGVSPGTLLDGKTEDGAELANAVENLAVAFYSLQQLNDDDRDSVLTLVQKVTQLMGKSPNQVSKLIGKSPDFQKAVAQNGD